MPTGNRNNATLTVALLATLKVILQLYHVSIITDEQLNDIVNGTAALATVIGVYMTHLKRQKQ